MSQVIATHHGVDITCDTSEVDYVDLQRQAFEEYQADAVHRGVRKQFQSDLRQGDKQWHTALTRDTVY